ncbi:hypothetical protein CDAR_170271 [Caerostris darwini]|uniref:Uncharacterized protein n=1 Tax=Caerostris darwini TaxID=1538125 RepID=A0AAV4UIW9_9ARAC|nr:hypothetical protein CDAR_170271 [Caerostris darwini]
MAHTNTRREPPHISSANSLKVTQLNRNALPLSYSNHILSAVSYSNRHDSMWSKNSDGGNNEEHPEAHSMLVERSSGYVKKSAMAERKSSVAHITQTKKKNVRRQP